ncbi:transmembrane protein 179B-like isoform X2 [Haliotis asinina]|uniref:transmembrane protein 179B-like isoform X2 n=1 Tax=Haliotis asinina TaxID=109174 RepID=UPI003531F6F2
MSGQGRLLCSTTSSCDRTDVETKHDNKCLLYSIENMSRGSKLSCNYSIVIAVMFCLLYPITVIIATFISIRKEGMAQFAGFPSLLQVITDGVAFFLVLGSACSITIGLKNLCYSILGDSDELCSTASIITDEISEDKDFYQNLSTTERGAWTAVIAWLLQLIGGLLMLWRNGRLCCRSETPSSLVAIHSPSQQDPDRF